MRVVDVLGAVGPSPRVGVEDHSSPWDQDRLARTLRVEVVQGEPDVAVVPVPGFPLRGEQDRSELLVPETGDGPGEDPVDVPSRHGAPGLAARAGDGPHRRQGREVVLQVESLVPEDRTRAGREAELLADVAVQALLEVRHGAAPGQDPAARERLVGTGLALGDRLEAVVRGKGEDDLSVRKRPPERLEQAPELDVQPPERVEVLLGLGAVRVGNGVLAREREAEDIGLLLVPELEVLRGEDLEGEVDRQFVDERAVVEAVEVAVRGKGHVLVPAEPVHGKLERPHLELGDRTGRARRGRREAGGVGHLPPREPDPPRQVPSGPRPVVAIDDSGDDGAPRRADVVGRGADEAAGSLVPPVDGVLPALPGHEDRAAVLARERDDACGGVLREQPVSERRDPQARWPGAEALDPGLRVDVRLVGAVDGAEGAVGARLEPAVRDDPGNAGRRPRAERGVPRSGLGVQVAVMRIPFDIPLVQELLQAGDEIGPVVEQTFHLEAVHRDEDGEPRRPGRGRGSLAARSLGQREERDDEREPEGESGGAELLHSAGGGPGGAAPVAILSAGGSRTRGRAPSRALPENVERVAKITEKNGRPEGAFAP